jgi:hypothetical protein
MTRTKPAVCPIKHPWLKARLKSIIIQARIDRRRPETSLGGSRRLGEHTVTAVEWFSESSDIWVLAVFPAGAPCWGTCLYKDGEPVRVVLHHPVLGILHRHLSSIS